MPTGTIIVIYNGLWPIIDVSYFSARFCFQQNLCAKITYCYPKSSAQRILGIILGPEGPNIVTPNIVHSTILVFNIMGLRPIIS